MEVIGDLWDGLLQNISHTAADVIARLTVVIIVLSRDMRYTDKQRPNISNDRGTALGY